MIKEQSIEDFCKQLGTTREEAEETLLKKSPVSQRYFDTKNGKGQDYNHLYFAIVSEYIRAKNILEIGVLNGLGTIILSSLFPESHICAIDLPKKERKVGDIDYFEWVKDHNISLVEKNSLFLLDSFGGNRFDFVWLDGGHNYPAVAWDFMYAYNCLSPGGILLMDDYNRPQSQVKDLISNIESEIEEDIYLIPWAKYDPSSKMAYIIKGKTE